MTDYVPEEAIRKAIVVKHLGPGDVVIMRVPKETPQSAIANFAGFWGKYFKENGIKPPMLIQLSNDVAFEVYTRNAALELLEGRMDNPEVPNDPEAVV